MKKLLSTVRNMSCVQGKAAAQPPDAGGAERPVVRLRLRRGGQRRALAFLRAMAAPHRAALLRLRGQRSVDAPSPVGSASRQPKIEATLYKVKMYSRLRVYRIP